MSEQVSRAEFNELKGQLELVCQHLGLELGDFVSQGSGRRRADAVEVNNFNGFDHEEPFTLAHESDTLVVAEEEEEGWESINDDEDPDHTISFDREEESEPESHEEDTHGKEGDEEVHHLPTSLNYADFEEEKDETPLFADESVEEEDADATEDQEAGSSLAVGSEALEAIFDVENVLTANDIASKQFSEIKKSLFTAPYDVDAVDEFLDEYLEVLQTRDVSESKYAAALLKLDGRKFPEGSEGYKKSEVDAFVSEIANELQRRINIVS